MRTIPSIKLFIAFVLIAFKGKSQQWEETWRINGPGTEYIRRMVIAPNNDLIVAGGCNNTTVTAFQSSDGTYPLTLKPDTFRTGQLDMFIARYSAKGQPLWTIPVKADNGAFVWDLHCDKAGNIIATGNFSGRALFYSTSKPPKYVPGYNIQEFRINQSWAYSSFVAKWDASGNLQWVKTGLSYGNTTTFQAVSDDALNVYIRTYCTANTAAFDKYAILNWDHTGQQFYNLGCVILKYAPDGEEKWIAYGGDNSNGHVNRHNEAKNIFFDEQKGLRVDCVTSGDIYLFNGEGKEFLIKRPDSTENSELYLDPETGNIRSSQHYNRHRVEGMVIKTIQDKNGIRYSAFDVWTESHTQHDTLKWKDKFFPVDLWAVFVGARNQKGDLNWIVHFNGPFNENAVDICFDKSGNIIVLGFYYYNLTITDALGKTKKLTTKVRSLVVASFTPEGKLNWASNAGDSFHDLGTFGALAVDDKNNLYVGAAVDMDSRLGKININVLGNKEVVGYGDMKGLEYHTCFDAYIAKMAIRDTTKINVDLSMEKTLVKNDSLVENPVKQKAPQALVGLVKAEEIVDAIKKTKTEEIPIPNLEAVLYPNPKGPEEEFVNIRLLLTRKCEIHWAIIDAKGQVMQERKTTLAAGESVEKFSFENYAKGVYRVIITVNKLSVVKNVILN